MITPQEFLNHVLSSEGLRCSTTITQGKGRKIAKNHFFNTDAETASFIMRNSGIDVYIACATYKTSDRRAQANNAAMKAFWLDIDAGPDKPYKDFRAAGAAVIKFCQASGLPIPTMVISGGGVHCWWVLSEAISPDRWNPAANLLKFVVQKFKLDADPSRTADGASILRVPGTYNWKLDQPRPVYCKVLQPAIDTNTFLGLLNQHRATITASNADFMGGIKVAPDMKQGYGDGARTDALLHRAGYCLGPLHMSEEDAIKACLDWNQHNTPPLDEAKIERTVRNIAAREAGKSQAGASSPKYPPDLQALLSLPRLEYELQRKEAAKKLNIRTDYVDQLYEGAHRTPDDDTPPLSGSPLKLHTPEPWPQPVNGAELLAELETEILKYVALPAGLAVAVALWIVHAFAFTVSFISPRLVIVSPEKRCGKTTLLRLVSTLSPRALMASNLTSASMFRVIEYCRPTLLIDEADSFLPDNEELRGIINSGHAHDGAVIRLVGDDHEPRTFSTFCPTALAAIGKVPGTIEDRAIVVSMRRKHAGEPVKRFRADRIEALATLAMKAQRWVNDNSALLKEADPEVPDMLHDRAADNWRPLLAIADLAGGGWPDQARQTALSMNAGGDDDIQSPSSMLLVDCRAAFQTRRVERIATAELIGFLVVQEGRPWAAWFRGNAITATKVANLLNNYGIRPKTLRIEGAKPVKGYEAADFKDAWMRYSPASTDAVPPSCGVSLPLPAGQTVTSVTPLICNNIPGSEAVTEAADVTADKGGLSNINNVVTDVTAAAPV